MRGAYPGRRIGVSMRVAFRAEFLGWVTLTDAIVGEDDRIKKVN